MTTLEYTRKRLGIDWTHRARIAADHDAAGAWADARSLLALQSDPRRAIRGLMAATPVTAARDAYAAALADLELALGG